MRFISPSFLVVTLLMSFLPWVEVKCEHRIPSPISLSHAVVDQNAFEIALGNWRVNTAVPGAGRNLNQFQGVDQKLQASEIKPAAAPLIWAVLGGALLGVIVGYAVPQRVPRLILAILAVILSAGGMITQAIIGFPLLNKATPQWIEQLLNSLNIADPELRGPTVAWVPGFTFFFYLACLGVAGGTIGVIVDLFNPSKPRSREDEDEDDDRYPRRRRSRRDYDDDDDDGDDRPRRRSRDEDKWPRRRRDDDEDEDDDRPRRRPGDGYRN
jgi:hypothetical protein